MDSAPPNFDQVAGFVLFGTDHLLALVVIAVLAIGVPLLAVRAGSAKWQRRIALGIGVSLPVYETCKIYVRVQIYGMPLAEQLPFHICSVALFLVAYLLIRRSYAAFEVAYFWAMGGTMSALLMPDVQVGFPSLAFVTFFTGHGLVILGTMYSIVVYRFRPTIASIGKATLATLAWLPVAGAINVLLGTNFLYLREKPSQPTIIDFLGPWPWYIAALVLVGVVVCFVLYLPFAFSANRPNAAAPRGRD